MRQIFVFFRLANIIKNQLINTNHFFLLLKSCEQFQWLPGSV